MSCVVDMTCISEIAEGPVFSPGQNWRIDLPDNDWSVIIEQNRKSTKKINNIRYSIRATHRKRG